MDSVGNALLDVKAQLDRKENPSRLLKRLCDANVQIFIREKRREDRKDNGYFLEVTVNDCKRHFLFYKRVSKSSTIKELKQMVFMRYSIPPKEQVWIINQKVISSSERLVDLKLEDLAMFFPVHVMTLHELTWPQNEVKSKQSSKWKCPKCSFENHIMSAKCLQCQELKDGGVIEEGEEEEEFDDGERWNSAFQNGGIAASNEVNEIPEELIEILQWNCTNCQVENSPHQTNCEVCNNDRPDNFQIEVANALQEYRRHGKEGVLRNKNKARDKEVTNANLIRECLGWDCMCTYKNFPNATTCDKCSNARPRNYEVPTKEQEEELIRLMNEVQNEDEENLDYELQGVNGKQTGRFCHQCSFINDPKFTKCEKCHHQLQADQSFSLGNDYGPASMIQRDRGPGFEAPNRQKQYEIAEWACSACSFINRPGRPGCEICGGAPPEEQGYPAIATRPASVQPRPSFAPKPKPPAKPSPAMVEQPTGWACTHCTFENPVTTAACGMCGLRRPDDAQPLPPAAPPKSTRQGTPVRGQTPPPVDPKTAEWNCGACSFLNRPGRPGCEICGNPPPEVNAQPQSAPVPGPAGPRTPMRPAVVESPKPKPQPKGWTCEQCTFFNTASRQGCEMCSGPPPAGFHVVEDEEAVERQKRIEQEFLSKEKARTDKLMEELRAKQDEGIIQPDVVIECPNCYIEAEVGSAVKLRNCGHELCKDCITTMVNAEESGRIACPTCDLDIDDRDIKNVIAPELWDRRLRMVEKAVAKDLENIFQCQTADCNYYVEVVDEVNDFMCKSCGNKNCLLCKAIHEKDETCQDYQDKIKKNARNDENARLTMEMFEELIKTGEALRCPKCEVILQKKDGCDWVRCSVCKLEICWATRGPRWGPNGRGDNTGGCRCRVGGKPCTPTCRNCH